MMEIPAAAVGGRGNLPGREARGSPDMDAHSRIHHSKHHSSSQDPTAISSTPSAPSHSVDMGASSSSYAFITHSQEGLRENRPPMIDNAGLARRRRRRTSQHDQAILEEEYRKCDRPDKAKRREIAALVEMGDKEVQIWFQNKRQSARRKLKPLLPHEIIPNTMKSSSPAPAYQHRHNYYHNRTGYTVWGTEEKREEEECNTQDRDDAEGEVRTKKLGLGAGDEIVPHMDPRKDFEKERGGDRIREEQKCKEQEQEAEYLGQRSSQYQVFSSSQSSSQNHGYYSQQETPARERDDDDNDDGDNHDKLPPAAVRRMSMSHMRLQEALSSPLHVPPPPPANAVVGPLTTPRSTQPQRRYSFVGEPPSELSEYIHSDFPQQQQTPIKTLPAPPLALPAPNPRRKNPQGAYHPPTLQKRSSSFLRLSTSLDGHAEVVIDTEPTLPPPVPHGLRTPRRGAPLPSTSSVLRDIDNMRSSRVWEFCCDKQQQPYLGSDGAAPNHHRHHHHHSALEPDEAGMALSIARSRRRIEASKDARRKLVFDDAALMRIDSGLGGMIDQRRGLLYDDDGPFGSGKKPEVEITQATLPGKNRISLGEVGSSNSSTAKPSTYPSTSTCRKRAYREIEIYEQPSSSQTTASLPPSLERHALPTSVPDRKKGKLFSPARAGGGGGEDYYIFGHESDKENYRDVGDTAVFAECVNVKQQRPVKALKKSLDTKGRGWRSGEKAPPPSGAVKKSKAKINIVGGDRTGTSSSVGGRGGVGDERRVKKKRKILGEVATGQAQAAKPGGMLVKGKKRTEQGSEAREVDVDLGGAELLLSLSAGRWGS